MARPKLTRLHSKRGRSSAPLLYYMPGPDDRTLSRPLEPHLVERPEQHVELARTGQLFHVFVKGRYLDTYLSPAISNSYLGQVELPRVAEARAALEV